MRLIRSAAARVVLVTTGALALAASGSTAAEAAPAGLQFSTNGTAWSSTPPASLFSGGGSSVSATGGDALVPGEARSSTLFVRNASGHPARFSAVVSDVVSSSPEAAVVFHLAGRDGTGSGLIPTPAGDVEDCTELVPPRMLGVGEIAMVVTEVSIPTSVTGTTGQGSGVDFRLEVGLADALLPTTPGGCPLDPAIIPSLPDTSGRIASTGASLVGETLAVAAGFAAVGGAFLLVAARRRRRERDADAASGSPHLER